MKYFTLKSVAFLKKASWDRVAHCMEYPKHLELNWKEEKRKILILDVPIYHFGPYRRL